jgi:NAD(P)-dependent dehydrogenase (short-subunit alcohol dehydrogenase family)
MVVPLAMFGKGTRTLAPHSAHWRMLPASFSSTSRSAAHSPQVSMILAIFYTPQKNMDHLDRMSSASKAGMIGLTKSLAKEIGPRGVTVNAIAPGFVPTDLTNALLDDLKDTIIEFTSMRRLGTPEDVAHLATFLASDRASFITGQVIAVDGGMVL